MDFDHHASELADETVRIKSWRTALETIWLKIGSGFFDGKDFVHFARDFSSPEKFLEFAQLIDGSEQMKRLFQAVDESIHPLREWISALGLIYNWLKQNDRKASTEKRIGYLACCSESVSNFSPSPKLPDVADEMLAVHGLE